MNQMVRIIYNDIDIVGVTGSIPVRSTIFLNDFNILNIIFYYAKSCINAITYTILSTNVMHYTFDNAKPKPN